MSQISTSCLEKQDLIIKYTKLIKLLQTKCAKSSRITLKSENFSGAQLFETSGSNVKEDSQSIQSGLIDSSREPITSRSNEQKMSYSKLALTVLCNRFQKVLKKKYFDEIKSSVEIFHVLSPISAEFPSFPPNLPLQTTNPIEERLDQGKILQQKKLSDRFTLKQLYRNNFGLQTLNEQLKGKIIKLQQELADLEKRFYKQTEKKRESLEAVAQQMRERNDFIADLQHTIKQYEKLFGKSFQKINLENVLIEDQLELKKSCLRLESINEKLNSDLRIAQSKIFNLSSEILALKKENLGLKTELSQEKQHNFELIGQANKTYQLSQIYSSLCQKLNKKIDKIKLSEKKNLDILKSNSKDSQILSLCDVFSGKNTEASSDFSPLSRKSSLRELEIEQKIESIFSFIFNVDEVGYKITNEDLFDEDELDLLKQHKKFYLNNVHNQNPQTKPRTEQVIKNPNLNETDEIIYLQSSQMNIENSFFNALEPQTNHNTRQTFGGENIKLMDLQIQKSKLIEKISDLKKMHMHIRDVFLHFLKTIEISNLKPETFRILEIIFDVFEYSEDEKASLVKEKKKKLFGIL